MLIVLLVVGIITLIGLVVVIILASKIYEGKTDSPVNNVGGVNTTFSSKLHILDIMSILVSIIN